MKRNKKSLVLMALVLCSIFGIFVGYRKYSEAWVAKDFYENDLFKRFDGFPEYEKNSYIRSLDNNEIIIKVDDLVLINDDYSSKVSHRKGWIISYTVLEPYGPTDYSFRYIREDK